MGSKLCIMNKDIKNNELKKTFLKKKRRKVSLHPPYHKNLLIRRRYKKNKNY